MEKKFWLVGVAGWLILQVPIGLAPLSLLYLIFDPSISTGFIFGLLLGAFVQIAAVSWVSSWLWSKWRQRKVK